MQVVQKILNIPIVSAVEKSVIKLSSHPGPHQTRRADPGMSHRSDPVIALGWAKAEIK